MLPLDPPVDAVYGDLHAQLERTGNLIGLNDLPIAAQVLSLDYIMVSDMSGHSRIPAESGDNAHVPNGYARP